MRRTIPASILILTTLFLLLAGCGANENDGMFMAPGSYSDLAVVTSSAGLDPLARRFLETLNTKRTFVIQEEGIFIPDHFAPEHWDLARKYKNALFLVRIGDGGDTESAVRKMLPSETWERLAAGGGGVVKVNDPWSSYQMVVVVASRDRNNLGSLANRNADEIRRIFTDSSRERILRRNRYEGLNTPYMDDNWQRFGFFMEIPADFERIQMLPDGFPGVEFMKTGPSRGITVTWTDLATGGRPLSEFRDELLALRSEMGLAMHEEEVSPVSLVWSEETLGANTFVKLEGAWTSTRDSFTGGGPFWSWFVWDQARGRVFCIDALVYAPGKDKMDFFRHLEAVASTFSLVRPQP